MKKDLPVPEHLAVAAPGQQGMAVALAVPAAAATADMADAPFETIPLESADPVAAVQSSRQLPTAAVAAELASSSPSGSLLHKLGLGFLATPASQDSAAAKAAGAAATPGATPRIAAVGTGVPVPSAGPAPRLSAAGSTDGVQSLTLHAPGLRTEQEPQQQQQQRLQQQQLAFLKQPPGPALPAGTASAASASVASFPLDSDSEAEEASSRPHSATHYSGGAFELVELSSTTVGPAVLPA